MGVIVRVGGLSLLTAALGAGLGLVLSSRTPITSFRCSCSGVWEAWSESLQEQRGR